MTVWYRNGPLKSTPYHAAAPDWVSSGRALCGANIAHPAFTINETPTTGLFKRCRRCAKKVQPVAIAIEV